MKKRVNYNKLADVYDKRYQKNELSGIETALQNLVNENNFSRILEVGCGTGHWLKTLQLKNRNILGLDYSIGMLKKAKEKNLDAELIVADANVIPFKNSMFDLIFCVNALHHFTNPQKYIFNSVHYLNENGMLTIICLDPRNKDDQWYVYDYFDGVYENDLKRFSSYSDIKSWMQEAGFSTITTKVVEITNKCFTGSEVLKDDWLKKDAASQLAQLNQKEYEEGINKIRREIKKNTEITFSSSITFAMISAKELDGGKLPPSSLKSN